MAFDLGPKVHRHLLLLGRQPIGEGRAEIRKAGVHFVLKLVQVGLHVSNCGRGVGLASFEFGDASIQASKPCSSSRGLTCGVFSMARRTVATGAAFRRACAHGSFC